MCLSMDIEYEAATEEHVASIKEIDVARSQGAQVQANEYR